MDVKPILAALAELQLRDLGAAGSPVQDNHRAIAAQAESLLDVVPETLRTLLVLVVEELAGATRGGRRFADLPVEERGLLLTELWAEPQRAARIGQVTRLLWLVIYSRPPARDAVGFKPLDRPSAAVAPIVPASLDETYDVCVIGSGAGGAVVAFRAAAAGKKVLLLDEGPAVLPADVRLQDDYALIRSYRNAGLQIALPTLDAVLGRGDLSTMLILQARVFGGGPAINNAIHLRMEQDQATWQEWQRKEFPVSWPDLSAAYDRVDDEIGVIGADASGGVGERSEAFRRGALQSGWDPKPLPVSIRDCLGCGGCNVMCRFGRKTGGFHGPRPSGAPLSYLERARAAGVQCRPSVRITRLHGNFGGTRVVMAAGEDLANGNRRVELRAKEFVLAAGPIASSKILIRSGIGVANNYPTGRGISANVVLPVFARLPLPNTGLPDPGLQMCYYVQGDGFLLESWFHFPGSLSLALSPRPDLHAQVLRGYTTLAACGVVVPTAPHGSLGITWDPLLALNEAELERARQGVLSAATLYFNAGAEEILPATATPLTIRKAQRPADEQAFRSRVRKSSDLMLSSAHPQGGNAIGKRAGKSVVGPEFRPHGIERLYVADGSLFPAGCGVNPQMTVMALAHLAAERLIAAKD
jgi:choline dehydrogenase-like flavoprotein